MAVASEQRRLLAILVADIVGYSNLMARFESETFQRVKELQSSLIVPAVGRNRGEIVKYTGDGFIATFASALDAVRAAVEVQSGAKAAAATASDDRRLLFRIGINVGDVIVVPGDIYGDSVNIAARLQGLAKPGGICVSRSVRDTVKGKFEIDFTDLGNVDVKNIPDPVGTYELNFQAIAWTMERREGNAGVDAPPPHGRGRWPLIAGSAAAAVLLAAGGTAAWRFWPPAVPAPQSVVASVAPPAQPTQAPPPAAAPAAAPSFDRLLDERLARMAPEMGEGQRAFQLSAYRQMAQGSAYRAIVVAPAANAAWRMPSNASAANAEERGLEGCQLRFAQPCATAAVEEALAPVDRPPWPLRDMPRLGYTGPFDPARIPAVSIPTRSRPDVVSYRSWSGPKAAALHPHGLLHVVSSAANQADAERQALAACTADPAHEGRNLPCFLYAVGDQVVLPRRATAPVTAAAVASPPPAAPAPAAPATSPSATPPAAAPPSSLRQEIIRRISARASRLEEAKRAELVDAYLAEKGSRAMAVAPGRSGTWRVSNQPSATAAEERVLEHCMVFYGEPCVVVAVDDAAVQGVVRASPRVLYDGRFDPDRIPAPAAMRNRPDILGYRAATGPKAVALHPWGLLHVVTGGTSQREAEQKALADCTASPTHRNRDLPCYLYASGDQVVLPRRASSPITP